MDGGDGDGDGDGYVVVEDFNDDNNEYSQVDES